MRIPHELPEEFSHEVSLIEQLRRTNYEFGRLATRYDEVNHSIHRIESEEEPTSDERRGARKAEEAASQAQR